MCAMGFREPNQVKWVGIRPAHLGTQIAKYSPGSAGNPTIIHTVTNGKVFFLTSLILTVSTYDTGGGGSIVVRDESDVVQYYLTGWNLPGLAAFTINHSFDPPLEIPAGYDIVLTKASGNEMTYAFIHGWEE
jgi:hypothetical protein